MKNNDSNYNIFKIIVTSDTHGFESELHKLILQNQNANMIIHLGDGEIEFFKMKNMFPNINMVMVKGNCDLNLNGTLPNTKILEISKFIKIFACHGHTLEVKQNLKKLVETAKQNKSNIALFGHTHIKFLKNVEDITLLNPGSLTKPRAFKPSFAKILIYDNINFKIEICDF